MLGWFIVDQARMLPGRGPDGDVPEHVEAVRARVFLCLVVPPRAPQSAHARVCVPSVCVRRVPAHSARARTETRGEAKTRAQVGPLVMLEDDRDAFDGSRWWGRW